MPPKDTSTTPSQRDSAAPARDPAAAVVRGQIDALYDTQAAQVARQAPHAAASTQSDHWKQYHTAWQQYYQKYYEQYYTGHMHRIISQERQQRLRAAASQPQPTATPAAANPIAAAPVKPANNREAIEQLRQKLKDTLRANAGKVRRSRHFIPIMAATLVVVVVAFLQYNSVLMATVQAYVSPGAIDPQNIVVDPTTNTKVGPDPKLIIPKINVDVPVVYGVAYTGDAAKDHAAQMKGMESGVIHFAPPGANSVPGQNGNTAISGHSSNDLFEPGQYKFVFAQLDKLGQGDTIYMNYQGTRYTYVVTKKQVVTPKDGDTLKGVTDKPILTLITCTPLGTSTNRLLITAEQISPDPAKAAPAPDASGAATQSMPGNSPSALEKIFGAR